MTKTEARKLFREKREAITASEKLKWNDLILIQFQTLDIPFLETVMSFYSADAKNEVNTFPITEYLHFRNPSLRIAYPRMNPETKTMDAVECNPDTAFTENEWGIAEPFGGDLIDPAEIELILVPLLAIDFSGNRVGYGKGYYDRFLSNCHEDCLKVGLSYFEPVDSIDDTSGFDVPLDLCVTPQQVYVF
jgi:5-formyltetrahydrofolate cyclo-ligase